MVYICCDGQVDFYKKRLMVEVFLLRDHSLVSNGEAMISMGLSVPYASSPMSYRNACTH